MATLAELQDALVNADRAGDSAAAKQLADAIYSTRQTQEAKPVAVQAGETLKGIPRQLGLTARYGLEGLADVAQIGTEPIRQLLVNPALKAAGLSGVSSLRAGVSSALDAVGLPTPEGANERVIGDATRMVAGGGGLAGVATKAAPLLQGTAQRAAQFFASNPGTQLTSAAGAGLAGGSVREAGGGPWSQAAAALAGGVAAPLGAQTLISGAQAVGRGAKNLATGGPQYNTQLVDQQINLVLRQQGIDWGGVSERVKQGMRTQVAEAMQTGGDLNPDAVRRMLDFARTGATPTRGMLTQDPVQLTREGNIAKVGANSSDIGLQSLARNQGANSERLLTVLDDAGARGAPDAFGAGQAALRALNTDAARSRALIDTLYRQARDTNGRSAALDGQAFTSQANQLLDEQLLGGALPKSVQDHMNRIAQGEVPFTVDYAEQLKTAMGNLSRGSNEGSTRMALGTVRRALDATPMAGGQKVGNDAIRAFNRARQANSGFMTRVENSPALEAAINGAQPDQFVKQFITGQGATVADLTALRRSLSADPQALQSVKGSVVDHLKSAATGGVDDIVKFNAASYQRALDQIGPRKLATLFTPDEVAMLESVGRVGVKLKGQPDGTAINNSNSGALVIGQALDLLDRVAGKLPLGADTMIQGVLRGTQQRQALNVPGGLLSPKPTLPISQRLGPAAIYGGLLATQPVD